MNSDKFLNRITKMFSANRHIFETNRNVASQIFLFPFLLQAPHRYQYTEKYSTNYIGKEHIETTGSLK